MGKGFPRTIAITRPFACPTPAVRPPRPSLHLGARGCVCVIVIPETARNPHSHTLPRTIANYTPFGLGTYFVYGGAICEISRHI